MCTVPLPPGVNPIAVKYMYHISYHIHNTLLSHLFHMELYLSWWFLGDHKQRSSFAWFLIALVEIFWVAGSLYNKRFAFLQNIRADSGAHPAFCWVSTRVISRGRSRGDVRLTTQPHLAWRMKNEWSYSSAPPIRLHGVRRDCFN
jgi:hypothetical protein